MSDHEPLVAVTGAETALFMWSLISDDEDDEATIVRTGHGIRSIRECSYHSMEPWKFEHVCYMIINRFL